MNFLNKKLFVVILIFVGIVFIGCGYKPSSYYAKQALDGNVYLNVDMSLEDPQNTILIKDAALKVLIQKLGSQLVSDEKNADIIISLSVSNVSLSAIQYDSSGYIKVYKVEVLINVNYFNKQNKQNKSFLISGEYDFSVDTAGSITDANRFDAISHASEQAMNQLVSKLAVLFFK